MPVIAITGDAHSPLARAAKVVIDIGPLDEACPIGLVPTASTAAMHAVCDALAMSLAQPRLLAPTSTRGCTPAAGSGRHALRVREVMRAGKALPLVRERDGRSRTSSW